MGSKETTSIEDELGALFRACGKTIATAESTTGGYIGHLINNAPGSSKYYVGSVVAYHTRLKQSLLNVPEGILKDVGSVSAQVVLAMAQNVREVMGTDIGVSESGIAGPTGGNAEKPLGTVFIAISTRDGYELVERYVFNQGRMEFKVKTAEAVLDLIRHYLDRDRSD